MHDINASITLAHQSCNENRDICRQLIGNVSNQKRAFTKMEDDKTLNEAIKVANKQWE